MVIFLLFWVGFISGTPLKVITPFEVEPDAHYYWKFDNKTNEMSGFFIELIDLLFQHVNLTYTLEYNTNMGFKTYTELGIVRIRISIHVNFNLLFHS